MTQTILVVDAVGTVAVLTGRLTENASGLRRHPAAA